MATDQPTQDGLAGIDSHLLALSPPGGLVDATGAATTAGLAACLEHAAVRYSHLGDGFAAGLFAEAARALVALDAQQPSIAARDKRDTAPIDACRLVESGIKI